MEKLLTEQNTPEVESLVREAFENSDLYTHTCETNFEHGQWWVTCCYCGAAWSVVDTNKGLDFEEVSHGDESHQQEAE